MKPKQKLEEWREVRVVYRQLHATLDMLDLLLHPPQYGQGVPPIFEAIFGRGFKANR